MNIKIPRFMVHGWDIFCDWGNVPAFKPIAGFVIRRLDLLAIQAFLLSVGWYTYHYGWRGTLQSSVAFVIVAALALFTRRG